MQINIGPMVPAMTGTASSARVGQGVLQDAQAAKTDTRLWLILVPMDGKPSIEEFGSLEDVRKALGDLVGRKTAGWVYLVDGVRQSVSFGQAQVVSLQGREQRLNEQVGGVEGLLPGTEVYPESAE